MSLPLPKIGVEEDKISLRSTLLESTEDGLIGSPRVKPAKGSNGPVGTQYLQQPMLESFRRSSDTASNLSAVSQNDDERRHGRAHSHLPISGARHASRSPARPTTLRGKCRAFWLRNKGLALVLLAQFFGGLMNVTARLLETSGSRMHPLQILFARMAITMLLSLAYMWYASVPDFPFGKPGVRVLLVARGISGFFGVTGLYYSLKYLPIAEATVITFLAPIAACFVCSFVINEPFTRAEQIAGLISLCGVVLIARPTTLFSRDDSSIAPVGSGGADAVPISNSTIPGTYLSGSDTVTPAERLVAIGAALIGVVGAAGAYTTIRWIGKRAHPLISVNYFASWCTFASAIALLALPNLGFKLPADWREWSLLFFLGTCGFIMQVLLTAGLQHEKSSRATNMVYTQMLFALAFDKIVWGLSPGVVSIVGSSLILGSAVYVALHRENASQKRSAVQNAVAVIADEERALVEGMDDADEDHELVGGVREVQLRTMRV